MVAPNNPSPGRKGRANWAVMVKDVCNQIQRMKDYIEGIEDPKEVVTALYEIGDIFEHLACFCATADLYLTEKEDLKKKERDSK